jgi:hypothetical protein
LNRLLDAFRPLFCKQFGASFEKANKAEQEFEHPRIIHQPKLVRGIDYSFEMMA